MAENKRHVGRLVFVGCTMLGIGIGMLLLHRRRNSDRMGVGFLIKAILRWKHKA